MNTYDLEGRAALVTGGASGIGQAVCARFQAAGASVATFDLQESTSAELSLTGSVTSTEELDAAVSTVTEQLAPVDILVCAAGIFPPASPTVELTDESWQRTLDVNATGTLRAIRAVLPGMVARGYGRIVTLASIAAREGSADGDAYAASKAAVVSLTRTIGRSNATTGVLINCVVPSLVATNMADDLSPAQRAHATATVPMRRLARPEEVATLITFLVSEDLSFSTGACFDITGGRANY